jgi:hypothetical protein
MPKVIRLDEVLTAKEAASTTEVIAAISKDELVKSGEGFHIGGCIIKNTEYGTLLKFGIQMVTSKEKRELTLVSTKPLRVVANKAAKELEEGELIGPAKLSQAGDFYFFTSWVKK